MKWLEESKLNAERPKFIDAALIVSSIGLWKMNTTKGFTLIELLIVVAIISMTMGIGLPSFQSIIASSRLTSATNAMVSALQMARMEAIKQHKSVVVRKTNGDWKNGWFVFVDVNDNNTQNVATEPTLAIFDSVSPTITIQSNYTNYISYTENGRANTGGHFTFCSGTDYRSVIIAATGRIRTVTIATCT